MALNLKRIDNDDFLDQIRAYSQIDENKHE